jgi:hypothetical protein
VPSITVCSEAFIVLGKAQAKSLGLPDNPIAIVPHPFGLRKRDEIRKIAEACADDIAKLACKA